VTELAPDAGLAAVALLGAPPGEVASKSFVNMRHGMLDAVRAALEKVCSRRDMMWTLGASCA
jgi:hypothetical protein